MPTQHCTCGAKYRFQSSAVGKKAKCKKCGRVFRLEDTPADGTLAIADDDGFLSEVAAAADREHAAHRPPVVARPLGMPDVVIETLPAEPSPSLVAGPDASRGYWSSVGWTFLFPTDLGSLMTFFMLWGMLCLQQIVLPWAPCFGFVGILIILGWYSAYRFATIASAAAGEDDLPGMLMTEGVLDDIVLPLFRWLGSWGVAMLPAVITLIILFRSGTATPSGIALQLVGGVGAVAQAATPELLWFLLMVVLGQFLWPIIVLCICLGGFETLYRIDLIALTIARTFPVYLLTAGTVFAASVFGYLLAKFAGGSFIAAIALIGAGLYLELVSMRLIGLYYHHFKHRFAWSWG